MTIELTRRRLIAGLGLVLCAPTIVRAASLMPVRALPESGAELRPQWWIFEEASYDGRNWFRLAPGTKWKDWPADWPSPV